MNCRKLFLLMLSVLLLLAAGNAALADGNVAKIGTTEYSTFDVALAAANSGDTITLLQNATTEGINLSKALTIDGGKDSKHTLEFTKHGIALHEGSSLTFNNCNVVMRGIGSTPYAAWNWMTISASNATLTLNNSNMVLDGTGTRTEGDKATHGIYFSNATTELHLNNKSKLEIRNYSQDALERDKDASGDCYFFMDNSTYISENNRSGITNTFNVIATNNSIFNVNNSNGNGSNASNFDFETCTVNFNNNVANGLSANNLILKNTNLTADGNGIDGVTFFSGDISNSSIHIANTKGTTISKWSISAGMYVKGNSTINGNSTLTIVDGTATGLLVKENVNLTIEEGTTVKILRNEAYQEFCQTKDEVAQTGGGIHVRSGASATLPSNAQLYNNHALVAGDDIYAEPGSTITFGNTGAGWKLDGDPDCTDAIDGWYDDSEPDADSGESRRWKAHATGTEKNYIKLETGRNNIGWNNPLALKAAHGLRVVPSTPDTPAVDVPQTGDSTPLMLYAALAALSLAAFATLLRRRARG